MWSNRYSRCLPPQYEVQFSWRNILYRLMSSDPTQRFSSRVEDYIRYRPSYPAEVIAFLERECGLTSQSRVADIGSGTGLLSELFLRFGGEVDGVEPNAEMRAAGERLLAGWPRFHKDYIRYRPSYPAEVIAFLERE